MRLSLLKNIKINLIYLVEDRYTDKNTIHSYLPLYQTLFDSKRVSAKNVLEIGIGDFRPKNGGSIKMWYKFFPNAYIYALDILDYDRVLDELKDNNRIKLFTSTDAYDAEFFRNTFSGMKFDILLDDGPHTLDTMKQFITLYSQVMADDGILVIEDVQDWSWISELTNTVPDNLKQYIKSYDLRENKGRYDDIVFTIDKSN